MLFLMGTDGAVGGSISPVAARNMLLDKARQQADRVFNLVKHLSPLERRAALRTALDAFRPDSANRVETTAAALVRKGMSVQSALREGLAREMAATTMTFLTEKGPAGMLQGLADSWLDLRERVRRGDGLSGLWSGLKKVGKGVVSAGGAVLKVAGKVAKGVYNIACSKVGKFAGPLVANAAGMKGAGKNLAKAQQAACGKKARKAAPAPTPQAPRRLTTRGPAAPKEKSKLGLYLGLGGAALVLAILASRSPTPAAAPMPMVITTGGGMMPAPAQAASPARA